MNSNNLNNLAKTGQLKAEPMNLTEFLGSGPPLKPTTSHNPGKKWFLVVLQPQRRRPAACPRDCKSKN